MKRYWLPLVAFLTSGMAIAATISACSSTEVEDEEGGQETGRDSGAGVESVPSAEAKKVVACP